MIVLGYSASFCSLDRVSTLTEKTMKRIRLALSLAIFLAVIAIGFPATRTRAFVPCTCFIPQINFYGVWIDPNACGGECDCPTKQCRAALAGNKK